MLATVLAAPAMAAERVAAVSPVQGPERPRDMRAELDAIAAAIRVTQETLQKLDAEAAQLADDRQALSARLVESADARTALADDIARLETRLAAMARQQALVQTSLNERNKVLSGLLGAMQRLGRSPPPALLVRPDDAVGALRSAMMLGTVVPQVQRQSAAFAEELNAIERLARAIEADKQTYATRLQERQDEEARLERLIRQRQADEGASRQQAAAVARRAERLATRATTLEGLIAALAAPDVPQATSPGDGPYDISLLRQNMNKMQASAAFSTLKGLLNPPVAGALAIAFGEADRAGRPSSGAAFATLAGDVVTAPSDAEILYSGPFRSYGQLLILNAGDGYHIVLAGMAEIDVDVGQFVLAGEPVARMGARRLASATGADALPADAPALYVEFRKDGQPVDPAPWWAERPSGRTRNDS